MPKISTKFPQVENNPWKDLQFHFDGKWIPHVDAALIGPENYSILQNLRYKDAGLEGVLGYSKINTTALTNHTGIRAGIHLRSTKTQTSYTLVHAIDPDDSDAGDVYLNRTAIGSQGQFTYITYDGTDYTNEVDAGAADSEILTGGLWGLVKATIPATVVVQDPEGDYDAVKLTLDATAASTHYTIYNDVDMVAAQTQCFSVYAKAAELDWIFLQLVKDVANWDSFGMYFDLTNGVVSAETIAGSGVLINSSIEDVGNGWYRCTIWGTLPATETLAYVYLAESDVGVVVDGDSTSGVYLWQASYTENSTVTNTWTHTPLHSDASSGLVGRFSDAPQGNITYNNGEESMIFGGDEQRVAALFSVDDNTGANPKDQTEKIQNELSTATERFTFNQGDQEFLILMTTRPIRALKYYIQSANVTGGAAQTIKYWNGTGWSVDQVDNDGTLSGGITLAQTGTVTFSSHSDGSVKLYHFEELYMYAYLIELDAGSCAIYHMTVDYAFQSVKDVWDGVYRQPIQCQMYDSTGTAHYEDFTLQVNDSSDISNPVGLILNGLLANGVDWLIIMFEEPVVGIRFTILGDMMNATAGTDLTLNYWDGDSWEDTSATDGTMSGAISFAQSGLGSWTAPTDEQPQTLWGSYGYAYQLTWDAVISGAKDSDPPTVVVDIISGIPKQKTIKPFDWAALYKSRLMFGGYSKGDEGNRMDFSVTNAPDAWNGYDSSDDAGQSLYFGGIDPIIAGVQLYNRFGANVFAMLLVLKKTEVYLLVGDDPTDFTIYPVSFAVGCAAAQTLCTAEVGLEIGEGLNRNAAIWLSHSGPMMFDGALLAPIRGIENYFDPAESDYISWTYIDQARAFVDPIHKEWNLLIPTGSSTICNTWLVYDLIRKRWFKKDPGTAAMPQTGWIVTGTQGERRMYGGIDTGYMMYIEENTSYDGAGIDQRVKTGDFFPSNSVWDLTRIKKLKVLMRKIPNDSAAGDLEVHYYKDTEIGSGMGLLWEDDDTATGIDFEWADWDDFEWDSASLSTITLTADIGLTRLVKANADMNDLGYAHAFEFRLNTTDVVKGFIPVLWGIRFRTERKDDTAT